jgi:hypothetical protein
MGKNTMKMYIRAALAALAVLASAPAVAGDFDGSKNLVCAPVQSMDCLPGLECIAGTPDDIGFPAFIRLDFGKKAIMGPKRTTAIRNMDKSDAQLMLQGSEDKFGWTLALDQASGGMTITIAHAEGAFVLFGNCTPL